MLYYYFIHFKKNGKEILLICNISWPHFPLLPSLLTPSTSPLSRSASPHFSFRTGRPPKDDNETGPSKVCYDPFWSWIRQPKGRKRVARGVKKVRDTRAHTVNSHIKILSSQSQHICRGPGEDLYTLHQRGFLWQWRGEAKRPTVRLYVETKSILEVSILPVKAQETTWKKRKRKYCRSQRE